MSGQWCKTAATAVKTPGKRMFHVLCDMVSRSVTSKLCSVLVNVMF